LSTHWQIERLDLLKAPAGIAPIDDNFGRADVLRASLVLFVSLRAQPPGLLPQPERPMAEWDSYERDNSWSRNAEIIVGRMFSD